MKYKCRYTNKFNKGIRIPGNIALNPDKIYELTPSQILMAINNSGTSLYYVDSKDGEHRLSLNFKEEIKNVENNLLVETEIPVEQPIEEVHIEPIEEEVPVNTEDTDTGEENGLVEQPIEEVHIEPIEEEVPVNTEDTDNNEEVTVEEVDTTPVEPKVVQPKPNYNKNKKK